VHSATAWAAFHTHHEWPGQAGHDFDGASSGRSPHGFEFYLTIDAVLVRAGSTATERASASADSIFPSVVDPPRRPWR